ncbi:MAG: hypothetical protein LRY75_20890 [Shewanella xiamenensis]|nr:hypothetical protein [Shewanella xiamenensis]MCD8561212.1 hypothetical protein [Shewanella xiamenensis]
MDLENIPTIESLLEQRAIAFTGNPDYIERFLFIATPSAPIDKPAGLSGDVLVFDFIRRPIGLPDSSLTKYNSTNDNPLYTVHFDENITITAHIQSLTDCRDKVIYQKEINPKRFTNSLKAAIRAIDQSPEFFNCTKCERLIDANVKSKAQPISCIDGACGEFISQHFDVKLAKVSSHSCGDGIRVDVIGEQVIISAGFVTWPEPHLSSYEWRVQKIFPLNVMPRQVKSFVKILRERKITTGKCKYCNRTFNVGRMYSDDTCYGCATQVYGVVY